MDNSDFEAKAVTLIHYTYSLDRLFSSKVFKVRGSDFGKIYVIEDEHPTTWKLNRNLVLPSRVKAKFKRRKPL